MCLRLVRRVRKVEERSDRGERELPLVRSAQHCSHATSRLWTTLRSNAPKQTLPKRVLLMGAPVSDANAQVLAQHD